MTEPFSFSDDEVWPIKLVLQLKEVQEVDQCHPLAKASLISDDLVLVLAEGTFKLLKALQLQLIDELVVTLKQIFN